MGLKSKLLGAFCALPLCFSAINSAIAQETTELTAQDIIENAPADAWRTLSPEDTLYMDLPSGRITIELRDDFAPNHVARIKELTRAGFYNGLIFHRVIEGFMAQGGDPTGTGKGGSDLPNVAGEFLHAESKISDFVEIGRDARAPRVGFLGPIPVGAQPATLSEFLMGTETLAWGLHCPGVMSMARADAANSANSQFFLMFSNARRALDKRYSIWGRIVDGRENSRRINRGEPPERPTPIVRMRIASDVPADERSEVQVLRTDSDVFLDYLNKTKAVSDTGYVSDICNVTIPTKIDGKVEL